MTIVNYKEFLRLIDCNRPLPSKASLQGRMCDGITVSQQAALRKLGIGATGIRYKGQATFILCIAIKRANNRMATPGQMRKLEQLGFQKVGKFTYKEAFQYLSNKNSYNEELDAMPWEDDEK